MKKTLAQRRSDWETQIRQWQESTLNQSAYCRTHGLSPSQFSYWKQKFNQPLEASDIAPSSADFIPVNVTEALPVSADGLSVLLPNGCQLKGVNHQTVAVAQARLKSGLL